jgi:hypothetical protein
MLLFVEEPNDTKHAAWNSYINWRTKVEPLEKQSTDIEFLARNVLLIQLDPSLKPLGQILEGLDGVAYKYKFFPEGIQWDGEVKG